MEVKIEKEQVERLKELFDPNVVVELSRSQRESGHATAEWCYKHYLCDEDHTGWHTCTSSCPFYSVKGGVYEVDTGYWKDDFCVAEVEEVLWAPAFTLSPGTIEWMAADRERVATQLQELSEAVRRGEEPGCEVWLRKVLKESPVFSFTSTSVRWRVKDEEKVFRQFQKLSKALTESYLLSIIEEE